VLRPPLLDEFWASDAGGSVCVESLLVVVLAVDFAGSLEEPVLGAVVAVDLSEA
jgi:hypothetical protein